MGPTLNVEQVALSRQVLETSRAGDSTTPLGSLFLSCVLTVINCFLILSLNLPCSDLRALPCTYVKSLAPPSQRAPHRASKLLLGPTAAPHLCLSSPLSVLLHSCCSLQPPMHSAGPGPPRTPRTSSLLSASECRPVPAQEPVHPRSSSQYCFAACPEAPAEPALQSCLGSSECQPP